MGQSATKEQKLHQRILQRILKEQGFAISVTKLVKLLVWVRDYCSWYPSSGSYDSSLWAKVGEELQTKKDLQLEVPEEIIITWKIVYTALNALKPAETILQAWAALRLFSQKQEQTELQSFETFSPKYNETPNSTQGMWGVDSSEPGDPFDPREIDTEDGPDLYPPLTSVKVMATLAPTADEILQAQRQKSISHMSLIKLPPFAPKPLPSATTPPSLAPTQPLTRTGPLNVVGQSNVLLDKCRMDALCKGDISILKAMPVVYKPNQAPEYAYLPYKVIKEFRKFTQEYGLQASFTMNLIQAIGESSVMTPSDWQSVLSMVLSSAQYTVWASEHKELGIVKVMENISAGLGIGENELLGKNNYAMGGVQAVLPRAVFMQAMDLTLKALQKVSHLGWREASFVSIRQGSQEPYVQVLDWLQTAIMRQIEQEQATEILLFQLATKKVQQGPSTAVGVPDLRSEQGEFQPKTAQSLQRSTARSASGHHTERVSEPYTWWGTRPPVHRPFPPSWLAPLDWQPVAWPGPPPHPGASARPSLTQKWHGQNRFP